MCRHREDVSSQALGFALLPRQACRLPSPPLGVGASPCDFRAHQKVFTREHRRGQPRVWARPPDVLGKETQ